MLLVYFLAVGLVAGLAFGGRPSRLVDVRFRWAPVALGGLLFQLVLFSGPVADVVGAWGPPLYVASTAAVLLAVLHNLRLPGFWLIAAGAAMNLAAIVANGGHMPASAEAFATLTGRAAVPTDAYSNSVVADSSTALAFLGDNFVLPRPFPLANVFSPGDVVIGMGAAWFLAVITVAGVPRARSSVRSALALVPAAALLAHPVWARKESARDA